MLKPTFKRITVECPCTVDEKTNALIDQAVRDHPEAELQPLSDHHLTIFHLGKPAELRSEIVAAGGDSTEITRPLADWLDSAESMVALLKQIGDKSARAHLAAFDDYNLVVAALSPRNSVLPVLESALILSYNITHALLREYGLMRAEATSFMRGNPNLRYGIPGQREFHVSLAEYAKVFEIRQAEVGVKLYLSLTRITGTEPSHND